MYKGKHYAPNTPFATIDLMKKVCFLFIFFFVTVQATTISVIVPCYYKHACYLKPLLEAYEEQTQRPDEIVISLSEANKVDISHLEERSWPFALKIIPSNDVQTASENRNIACTHATGELIICQDSDDLPHPQRVEIINYYYQKTHFDFLIHSYFIVNKEKDKQLTLNQMNKTRYDPSRSIFLIFQSKSEYEYLKEHWKKIITFPLCMGTPAFKRELFNEVQWEPDQIRAEDRLFAGKVFHLNKKSVIIPLKIYAYLNYASSFNQ